MKKLIIFLIAILLLSGCNSQATRQSEQKLSTKIVGTFEKVEIISKKKTKRKGKFDSDKYYITVQKGTQTVQFRMFGEDGYNALQKGNIVDISYTDEFYIKQIKIYMEGDNNDND